jgi:HPt (histidine-containing phosphotransfer) domain-containing protein
MSKISPNQDLDLTLLNEIADGSDEFIVESIDMFLRHTPELLQTISDCIGEKDWDKATAAVHKLKPTLGFFGMLNSQELLQEIETDCSSGAEDAASIILKFLEARSVVNANMVILANIKREAEDRL